MKLLEAKKTFLFDQTCQFLFNDLVMLALPEEFLGADGHEEVLLVGRQPILEGARLVQHARRHLYSAVNSRSGVVIPRSNCG